MRGLPARTRSIAVRARPFALLALTIAGLSGGLVLTWLGREDLATWVWAGPTGAWVWAGPGGEMGRVVCPSIAGTHDLVPP